MRVVRCVGCANVDKVPSEVEDGGGVQARHGRLEGSGSTHSAADLEFSCVAFDGGPHLRPTGSGSGMPSGSLTPLPQAFLIVPHIRTDSDLGGHLTSGIMRLSVFLLTLMADLCNCPSMGVVAFSATITKDVTNFGSHQPLVFDKVITNVGGAYDSRHGTFRAPVDGIYQFSFSALQVRMIFRKSLPFSHNSTMSNSCDWKP
ncbi:hypothetical protein MAR_011647 [Mya arenaria]|uniref:C1q domain-containing protein n=1 Tax=Mya arenaria TaxID=6604 RepID=A0ABY7FYG3_MYAAR|nr:hypothetical protein MAR_011647 [Mya arenaria]